MGEKGNIAAFFDFDGTLFKGHLWQGIVKHHIKYKVKLISVLMYLATNFPLAFAGELASKINIMGEVINDVYSGRIIKPLCFGINKAKLLEEFISQARLNIDFGLSFAYADSVLDAPILQLVGNPVATYPDRELLTLAERQGWQILPSSYSPESRQPKPR